MCAIAFACFAFAWLYWFQADVLMVTQYVFSKGQTHYNRLIATPIIIAVLLLIQNMVVKLTRLDGRFYSLSYLPSMLSVALLCGARFDGHQLSFSYLWLLFAPLVLCVWGGIVYVGRQLYLNLDGNCGLFSRLTWINLVVLILMMFSVVGLGNTDSAFLYRTHMEASNMRGKCDEALRTGARSQESDVHLTMLRAYALSTKGLLAERLFEYPVKGTGNDLLPLWGSRSATFLLPSSHFYKLLGAKPVGVSSWDRYFELLEKDSLAKKTAIDYRLCGMLVDRRLDDFVQALPRYYSMDKPLPKHYSEAVKLYMHLRANPAIIYSHSVTNEDWSDFQQLRKQYTNFSECKLHVAERYAGSYWFYYYFEK